MDASTRLAVLDVLVEECHANARAKGFWDGKDPRTAGPAAIALMHSELSEALEVMRLGMPEPEGSAALAEEFADVLIRVLDYCGAAQLDLGRALIGKMEKNRKRPRMHGKVF
jgi:NTP pyrophosphatase (non-canonical NTP hydrolase)